MRRREDLEDVGRALQAHPGARAQPGTTPESVEPSVEYDEVDEASVESMPASDPPARGVVRVGEPRRPCDPVPR